MISVADLSWPNSPSDGGHYGGIFLATTQSSGGTAQAYCLAQGSDKTAREDQRAHARTGQILHPDPDRLGAETPPVAPLPADAAVLIAAEANAHEPGGPLHPRHELSERVERRGSPPGGRARCPGCGAAGRWPAHGA